jgi:curved DNA-binding protein CbpA
VSQRAWTRREVLAFLDRIEPVLDKLNHFELLDVGADASGEAIQAAFHRVASGIHPDQLRRDLTGAQRERLTIVYARVAGAYRVLRDPDQRARYVREEVAREEAAGDEGLDEQDALALLSPKAQRHYRRARTALTTGDRASALLNLKMALALHPKSSVLLAALAELQSR